MTDREIFKRVESLHFAARSKKVKINAVLPKRRKLQLNSDLQKIAERFGDISSKLSLTDGELVQLMEFYFDLNCYRIELERKSDNYLCRQTRLREAKRVIRFLNDFLKDKGHGRSFISGQSCSVPAYLNMRSLKEFRRDLNDECQNIASSIKSTRSKKFEDYKNQHLCKIARIALNSRGVREAKANTLSGSLIKYNKNVFALLDRVYGTIYLNYSGGLKGLRFQKAWEKFGKEIPEKPPKPQRPRFIPRAYSSNEVK